MVMPLLICCFRSINHNIHILDHSQIHDHIPGSMYGVQVHSHTHHRFHREHQTLVQHRAFHTHNCHSQDHIHGHSQDGHNHVPENKYGSQDHIHGRSQEKSSQDGHNHVPENKHGVQDHILHKYRREHQPLAQHRAFHIHRYHSQDHIHGHIQEKSSQDVLHQHHTQDDDQHSHTEGQHQQQPE